MLASVACVLSVVAVGPAWLESRNRGLGVAFQRHSWNDIQAVYDPEALLVANSERIFTGTQIAAWAKRVYTQGIISSLNLTTEFVYQESPTLLHSVTQEYDASQDVKFHVYTRWINETSGWLKAFEAILRPRTPPAARLGCVRGTPAEVPPPSWLKGRLATFADGLSKQNVTAAVSVYHPGALQIPATCDKFVLYPELPRYFVAASKGVTFAEADPVHVYKESATLFHEVGTLITNLGSSSYYNRWIYDQNEWRIAVGIASVLPGGHCMEA